MTAPHGVPPHLLVVFGGTGDLMKRKLLPALARLARSDLLGERYALLAIGRTVGRDDRWLREWAAGLLEDTELSGVLDLDAFHYHGLGDGDYEGLARRVAELEGSHGLPGNRTLYLALPPDAFPATLEGLGEAGLHTSRGWTRVVVEKPFGRDLESARALNALAHRYFDESQLYRIDHYLGKETVQNLLVFRFANTVFESLWNRDRVESVQITVAESVGVGSRAGYYDAVGALRDMVQNHVTQLVALVGMEAPVAFDADQVRNEKIKLLRAIRPLASSDVVFGQYTAGGGAAGYKDEKDVADDSGTETYVALRLAIESWRWQGVPFFVRTGKRLERKVTQIAVTFRDVPVCLFESLGGCATKRDVLRLTLQPDEGFSLGIDVKVPGEPFRLRRLPLHFTYREVFGSVPDAYDTLLHDVLVGDQTLFVHADEVETSWRLYTPLLAGGLPVHPYAAGSWGPEAADGLPAAAGHAWQPPEEPTP